MEATPQIFDFHIHHSMVRMQIENISFLYKNVQKLPDSVLNELKNLGTKKQIKKTLNRRLYSLDTEPIENTLAKKES